MKIVTVNSHTYQMSDELAAQTVTTASESMVGRISIFAITKDDHIEMRRDTFQSKKKLMATVAKFVKAGFAVSYHTGEANAS